jgi:ABC-type transport system substrate-binding protein
MSRKIMLILGILVVASMVMTACQPQTIIETKEVEVPVEVTKEVVVTQQVEVEKKPFTTPHPILGDVKVRQAIAYCTNKLDLIKSVYPLVDEESQKALIMNTFIPSVQWAYAGDENITIYSFDAAKGGALLDEAGWTLNADTGFRQNAAGEELSLKFTTTTAAFRQTWAAVFEKQMSDCGIRVLRFHVPASWWFGDTTGLARRDFELGAFAWVGTADPGGNSLWACDQIPSPDNGWVGQNYMGWCNDVANKGIKLATNSLAQADRIKGYTDVQAEYTKDVPAIPLFNRTDTFAYSPKLTGFEPKPGDAYYTYNVDQWENGTDTIVLGFTQEPASLFGLVEDAFVAQVILTLIGGENNTSLDYTYAAKMQKELPTIESGLTTNNDIEVKEGDMVWDSSGTAIALAAGVKVYDNTGAEVEYAGTPITMKQLIVKYEFVDGLTFSDGTPVTKADYELYYKIRCDKESGATTFTICDETGAIEFADNGYTLTYLPGVQDPTYFLAPYGFYAAHRVIESDGAYKGKTLADVPAKDWATLPEVATNPIDAGPYVLKEWVKGEKLVLEANPYYVFGVPKTKNIVVSIITPENAEAQLIGGQVDVLDSTTLVGVTQTLKDAETAGTVKLLVNPSATWEHIDFSLFAK